MGFAAIWEAVGEYLPEAIRLVGPDDVGRYDRPQRISWDPVSASPSAPQRLGTAAEAGPLYTRDVSFELELWGESLEATEEMLASLVNAMHKVLSQHGYRPGSERWNTGAQSTKGVVCVLTVTLRIPLQREQKKTVRISEIAPINQEIETP